MPVLPAVALEPVGAGRYEGTFNGFFTVGIYDVAVYAMDVQGNVSQPMETYVEQTQAVASQLRIDAVMPSSGPRAGGNTLTLAGSFPVAQPIATVAGAEAAYIAFVGNVRAHFTDSEPPVVTDLTADIIAPASLGNGAVDVRIYEAANWNNNAVMHDGYRYLQSIGGEGEAKGKAKTPPRPPSPTYFRRSRPRASSHVRGWHSISTMRAPVSINRLSASPRNRVSPPPNPSYPLTRPHTPSTIGRRLR